jgi:hypothetical protein
MNARFAAVGEDVGVVAAGFLEGIRQDRHAGEVPLLVHLRGDPGGVFGAPCRVEGDRAERVAEDVAEDGAHKIPCRDPPSGSLGQRPGGQLGTRVGDVQFPETQITDVLPRHLVRVRGFGRLGRVEGGSEFEVPGPRVRVPLGDLHSPRPR